ncbi:MAG: tol-pal system protein YbgF [Gemmatimonadetes bacterium]|nr:tol-pal system protein YbgF [Gemmatimonadota bacterium]NIO30386.1 tol-pal system protein YbgF [Gemmatimonadota bacterium]
MKAAAKSLLVLAVTGLAACASKKDVDRIREDLASVRARQDSIATSVEQLESSVSEALENQGALVVTVRGDLLQQLDDMERQLVEIQELLGQSQIVLSGLRDRMEQRQLDRQAAAEEFAELDSVGDAAAFGLERGAGGEPRSLYSAAIEQFRRGAYETARTGFREFLVEYPADELAPDAQYYLAETYREEGDAGRAIREYNRVVELYPNSSAAPTALYKAGLLQIDQGNKDTACEYFQRVMAGYPRSDESRLARDQAERLSCR